jgi:2-dehydro-3-deoxygalactonokinase
VTSNEPAAICVDWGTSSFRAYLASLGGAILARKEAPRGILTVAPGDHEEVLSGFIGEWFARPLPVLMSGMIGARQGWAEAPYAPCPTGLREIAAAIVAIPTRSFGAIALIPGVSALDRSGAPDVMRGEETQILGALAAMNRNEAIFVLPGTHSKWARIEGGRIVSFATYMTGEIFAALKGHTILGALMASGGESREGFAEGVRAASRLDGPGDLLHAVFMTRTLGLFGQMKPEQLPDYLSGLLIGAELLSGGRNASGAVVIGSPELTARYCRAGELLGLTLEPAPADCALRGQLALLPLWTAR